LEGDGQRRAADDAVLVVIEIDRAVSQSVFPNEGDR